MSLRHAYGAMAAALVSYVDNNSTDMAGGTLSVPVAHYTDPAIWQREMALIFHRLPLLAALTIELPNPGDFKTLSMSGKPVLITRGKDGKVHAFLNVCTHRGTVLAAAPQGSCVRFSCPYHGWTFNNEGTLLGISDRQKFGDVDTRTLNLTALPCAEQAGLIFVILTPGLPIDLKTFLGGMLDDLEAKDFATWHYIGAEEVTGANWKIAYDGYLEGYHFATAHPHTIAPRTFSNVMHFTTFGPHMRIGFPARNIADLKAMDHSEWGAQENESYDFVRTLFPNVSIFVAPEATQIAQLLPGPGVGENRTILHYISRHPPADNAAQQTLASFCKFVRDVVDAEDYQLGLKVQEGLRSGALQNVVFGRNEYGNQTFHKWVDYYLRDDPAAPPPAVAR